MAAKLSLVPDKSSLPPQYQLQSSHDASSKQGNQPATARTGIHLMQLNENDMFGLEFDRIRQKNEIEQLQQQQQTYLYQQQLQQQQQYQQQFNQQQNNVLLNRQGNLSTNTNLFTNLNTPVPTAAHIAAAPSIALNNHQVGGANFYRAHARSQSCNNINYNQLYAYIPTSNTHFNILSNNNSPKIAINTNNSSMNNMMGTI
jgi:hypothetical protein